MLKSLPFHLSNLDVRWASHPPGREGEDVGEKEDFEDG